MSATRPPTQDFGIVMVLLFFFAALVFAALNSGCGQPKIHETPQTIPTGETFTLWCISASARDDGEALLGCSASYSTCVEMWTEIQRWGGQAVSEVARCAEVEITR